MERNADGLKRKRVYNGFVMIETWDLLESSAKKKAPQKVRAHIKRARKEREK
jgi:hypothetical protein